MHYFFAKLRALFRKEKLDRDMAEEMQFHLAQRAAEHVKDGMPQDAARYAAQRKFGGVEQIKERARDERGWLWLEQALQDVRHAARSLRRSPGLMATAALSLGLGIGVNVALLAVVKAVFLGAPTTSGVGRFAAVEPGNSNQFSYLNYRDLRDSGIFAGLVAFRPVSLRFGSGADREKVSALTVSENFFEVLGVQARRGRVWEAREAAPELQSRLVVLGHDCWQRRFQSDPAIVGRQVTLNGDPFLVLGVLPESYRAVTPFMDPAFYVPLSKMLLPALEARETANLNVIGSLPKGLERGQIQAAVTVFGQRLEKEYPDKNDGFGRPAKVFSLRGIFRPGVPQELFLFPVMLLTLFGLVLLIACANVAGLLLARGAGRRREMAIRIALGAGRGRLVRAMLAESLLLSFLGAAAGLLLAIWLIALLGSGVLPGGSTLDLAVRVDWALYVSGFGVALLTGFICGIVPALRATHTSIASEIHQGGGHGTTGRSRLRQTFVVAQVAASLTLLIVSSLFFRSLARIASVDPGFDLEHGLVATIELDRNRYADENALRFAQDAVERIEKVFGVRSAAVADLVPLAGDVKRRRFEAGGRSPASRVRTLTNSVGPRYFETMGIKLLRGRDFLPADRPGAPPVAVVNQTFAKHHFPDQDPIGQRVRSGDGPELEIVGVAADSKYTFLSEEPQAFLYYAYAQHPGSLTVQVRTVGTPTASLVAVKRAIEELDPMLIAEVKEMREATQLEFTLRRTGSAVLSALGLLGLLLALIGLYGVMAYIVASRTVEIGIRMALGATAQRVIWDGLKQGLRIAFLGIALGAGISLLLTRPLTAVLAGLSPSDPIVYGATALALALCCLAASYLPARRAAKVDPMVALRAE